MIVFVESQILAVLEATAGQQNRHVFHAVLAGIAKVTAEENHRPVEQAFPLFLCFSQLCQEIVERLHLFKFQNLELGDLGGVLAVVRKIVMSLSHPRNRRHAAGAKQLQRDEPR